MGTQFKELWSSLGANQKISLLLACGLVVLSMIGMMIWAAQPQMELLYGKVPPEEASKILAKLEQEGVKYETGAGGNSIYVEAGMKDRIRVQLAGEGIPSGSGPGFELFDESNFGISDFVQRTNLQRAIQGELSRTISQFHGIDSARVMVVMPENRLLSAREGRDRPTASVFVEAAGKVEQKTVNSIRHLVANAIQRLDVNDVVVVDSNGEHLSEALKTDGLGTGLNTAIIRSRQGMETYFSEQVQSMLDVALGPGQSEVRVAVDIDTTSVQTTEKIFDPESQVARSLTIDEDSQIEREKNSDNTTPAAGAASNVQNQANQAPAATGMLKEREDTNKTRTENFEINEKIVSSVQNPGTIKRITASVLVAKRFKEIGGDIQPVERTVEEMDELREMVVNALGINLRPGQQASEFVTVSELVFAENHIEDHSQLLREEAQFQRWVEMGKNGIGAFLGIGVIIFFWQMLKRHKPDKISIEVLQPEQMLTSNKIEDTSVVTPDMLNELIRQKPANIGVSLREWIGDEVGRK